MRRLWISVAILGGMIALLIVNAIQLSGLVEPLTMYVTQASEAALAGEWPQANILSSKARSQWNTHTGHLRLVQCHTDIDTISVLLDEAEAYLTCQDIGGYTAANARIIGAMNDIRDLERISLGNLF